MPVVVHQTDYSNGLSDKDAQQDEWTHWTLALR